MNKEDAIKKINDSDGDDFQVFTKDEHETFLNNLKDTDQFKKAIDTRMGEFLGGLDDTLEEVIGERRDQGVKTSDFIRQKFSGLLESQKEFEEKTKELQTALESKSSDNEAVEQLKKEVDSLRKKHQNKMDEWQAKYADLEKNSEKMRVLSEIEKSMIGLKFKDSSIIPQEARDALIEKAQQDLLGSTKFVDGKLVMVDENGDILRDDKLNPVAPVDALKQKLKPVIDEGRKQPGVDINEPDIGKDENGKPVVNLSIPDTVKTNADLTDYLMKSGLRRDSDEYIAAYAKYSEGLTKV